MRGRVFAGCRGGEGGGRYGGAYRVRGSSRGLAGSIKRVLEARSSRGGEERPDVDENGWRVCEQADRSGELVGAVCYGTGVSRAGSQLTSRLTRWPRIEESKVGGGNEADDEAASAGRVGRVSVRALCLLAVNAAGARAGRAAGCGEGDEQPTVFPSACSASASLPLSLSLQAGRYCTQAVHRAALLLLAQPPGPSQPLDGSARASSSPARSEAAVLSRALRRRCTRAQSSMCSFREAAQVPRRSRSSRHRTSAVATRHAHRLGDESLGRRTRQLDSQDRLPFLRPARSPN